MKRLSLFIILLFPLLGISQEESSPVFSLDSFFQIVKKHHPIAIQAEIQLNIGNAGLREARGGFDPKLDASLSQKYFKDQSTTIWVMECLKFQPGLVWS